MPSSQPSSGFPPSQQLNYATATKNKPATGDLNAKHPFWHSRCSNAVGNILYNHAQNDDYIVAAPSSPTFFPAIAGHRPDVLDIALIRLPQLSYDLTNLNELSSDHNPVLLTMSDSPITSLPPQTSRCINWTKYMAIIDSPSTKQPIRTPRDIVAALDRLSTSIMTAVNDSTYIKKKQNIQKRLTTRNRRGNRN